MSSTQETESMDDVNQNLDELILYKVQLIQKYLQLSLLVEKEMKEGFIQLARARYLAGSGSVSLFGLQNVSSGDLNNIKEKNDEEDISATVTVINNDRHREINVSSQTTFNFLGLLRKDKNSYKKVEEIFRSALERNIQRINTMDEIYLVSDKIGLEIAHKLNLTKINES